MGDVESVHACAATALVDIEAEDTAVAAAAVPQRRARGHRGHHGHAADDLEGSLSILGEKGTVEIGGLRGQPDQGTGSFVDPRPADDDVYRDVTRSIRRTSTATVTRPTTSTWSTASSTTPALVDGLEGRQSLELITAIYESIETGREVRAAFHAPRWAGSVSPRDPAGHPSGGRRDVDFGTGVKIVEPATSMAAGSATIAS